MFPKALPARNRRFLEAAVALHQAGAVPANACLLDLDAMAENAAPTSAEAARMRPDCWTVFNAGKAAAAAPAARDAGYAQALPARVQAPGDRFYPGHEGGFDAAAIEEAAEVLDRVPGGRFAGLTAFPAPLYDRAAGASAPRPICGPCTAPPSAPPGRAGKASRSTRPARPPRGPWRRWWKAARPGEPATARPAPPRSTRRATCPSAPALPDGGFAPAPGPGLLLRRRPLVDPVFAPYPLTALVGPDPEAALSREVPAEIPEPVEIDYYGRLRPGPGRRVPVGDTVIFGFRAPAFVTRAFVAPVADVATAEPAVEGIWTSDGREAAWAG